ncbi:MAG TPA: DUF6174 domain-containing protein [Actinoplanes sp.]|nr:DUF6174 domain-containing protein [Actinoplanes sp.]
MTFRIAVPILAVALVAGCTAVPDETAPIRTAGSPPAWTEPSGYRFVVDRACDGEPSRGRYRVTVQDGEVASTERIDGKTAAGEEEIQVPSLAGLMELARIATDDGAEATVARDPADGHPTEVRIKRDAEDCFVVSEYAIG